jgi:hypothetical protein
MSAKDCLAWIRKIHAFVKGPDHPQTQPGPPAAGSAGALAAPAQHSVTLEARLYLLMERKYGLRALAVRQAAAFLLALERLTNYQPLHDVPASFPVPPAAAATASGEVAAACEVGEMAVFLGAFRNEIEEDYYTRVLAALVKSVEDLLLVARRQRQQQHQQQQQQQRGGKKRWDEVDDEPAAVLTLQEWVDQVLRFLHSEADCRSVVDLLKRRHQHQQDLQDPPPVPFTQALLTADQPRSPSAAAAAAAAPLRTKSMVISHGEVLRVLLEYQLHAHRRFLSTIRDAFAAADDDGDGQLTAAQAMRCFDGLLRQHPENSQQQQQQQPPQPAAAGAASSLRGVVERVASAAVAREAADPGSPLHRRRAYVKKQTQLTAQRKTGATAAARAQLRENFVRVLAADHVHLDEHSRITFTAFCRCINQLFVA